MGCAQSMGCAPSRHQPDRWRSRTKYEEFAWPLRADPFKGPSAQTIQHINESEPWEFEPMDKSELPLLVLAKDNEIWFGCLIEKCDPRVTWKGDDGQEKELGALLMGRNVCNYRLWSTKLEEWRRRDGGPTITAPPTNSPVFGRQECLAEFGNLAVALGITIGGAALGFPAAALGPVVWMVIQKWHTSFSKGIGSTSSRAQELRELRDRFDGCAKLLGRVITQFGVQIEANDADPLESQATERRAELQMRVETLKSFLEADTAEMARIARSRTSRQEKKRIMLTTLRSLFDLYSTQEVVYNSREMLQRMASQQQPSDDTIAW